MLVLAVVVVDMHTIHLDFQVIPAVLVAAAVGLVLGPVEQKDRVMLLKQPDTVMMADHLHLFLLTLAAAAVVQVPLVVPQQITLAV